jgi:putative oxidoreductase
MLKKLLGTSNDWTLTVIRGILGSIMFLHGTQKMFGWFGGYGFNGTMGYFTQTLGIPAIFGFLAIVAEFFGGLALVFGLVGRLAAMGIMTNMIVATLMVHVPNGLFMNWFGNQRGEGFEYHIFVVLLGALIVARGSGPLSVDRLLTKDGSVRAPHSFLSDTRRAVSPSTF